MNIKEKIDLIINEIRETVKSLKKDKLIVAFSGGLDSTVTAILCREALGPRNVELVNVVYGPFTYKRSIQIVKDAAKRLGLKITFLESLYQKEIWKNGPSCNMCTKSVKMNTVKMYAKDNLVVTGSNQSDSWGKTGLKVFNGLYAPLANLNKREINDILNYFSFKLERIGENAKREGCKLKHLLKIMTNLDYHGKAVDIANEILIENVPKNIELANVKIIGPLSKNIAIINVKPMVENIEKIAKKIRNLAVIDEVIIAKKPLILHVIANPSIYRVKNSRYWIEKGKLQPEFAVPIKVIWKESKNNKLRTIQVVGVEEWKDFEKEKLNMSLDTDLEIKNSCSLL
ncbi:ExsB family protein [Thermosipho melanesiensis]|uniref:ExsB family protein n=2 Tax=Thermosipho melanesiensis TaxID=46541 RepID=A6LNE8_THEM4|nr:ExsB family transcriptional regulator [Thermosipho melanesiensis]ABR31449.1 ExsB family protein [Thermosipho melanesiensis BI429]APT74508.1 ExsB family protein [Thermosipho melanesiensis]OOC36462.1 ExsB family protein [Thermosipho melanesiensis]OOC37280.1 ExsB family protein [Thermosipho melanesiensis]OOC38032.1 ExsB family protein [Thermosipho melanesiensis]